MKFVTGSNAERTQKYGGSKYNMTYVRPYTQIHKHPRFFPMPLNISVSFATTEELRYICEDGYISGESRRVFSIELVMCLSTNGERA